MRPSLTDVVAVRAGIAAGVMLALAAVLVHIRPDVTTGLLLYVAGAGLSAVMLTLGYACLVGLSAWGFLTGFVVNTGGQLTLGHGDLERLMVLVVLPAAVSVLRPRHPRRARSAHGSRV